MSERPYPRGDGVFNPACVCGGSINRPNPDCERCAMHGWIYKQAAEIERLRADAVNTVAHAMDERHDDNTQHCACVPVLREEVRWLRAERDVARQAARDCYANLVESNWTNAQRCLADWPWLAATGGGDGHPRAADRADEIIKAWKAAREAAGGGDGT